jgi:hypothetical protein
MANEKASKSWCHSGRAQAELWVGRGHGMVIVHIIKNGEVISDKHVKQRWTLSDPLNHLDLEGKG